MSGSNTTSNSQFLLVGNAPYLNRGCEAIVRGTVEILDHFFGRETRYDCASFGQRDWIDQQSREEPCSRIRHHCLERRGRLSVAYLNKQINRFCGTALQENMYCIPDVDPLAALQIGGDNYTLDYRYPRKFMELDHALLQRGVPLVLWGASVGPFSSDPVFEAEMVQHLSKFALITVREPKSLRYLNQLGLKNTRRVADPAFAMAPEPVSALELPAKFIGLNLSPMAGKKICNKDFNAWSSHCAAALKNLLAATHLPVVLVPHVYTPTIDNNDLAFLDQLARTVNEPSRARVLRPPLNAAQLKWVIGQATLFAGARTHSTIAALSQCVPTLSLAYSAKAWGVNEDIFGHVNYCMSVERLLEPDALAAAVVSLLKQKDHVQQELRERLPGYRASALAGGEALRQILLREPAHQSVRN